MQGLPVFCVLNLGIMEFPEKPDNEEARLHKLKGYHVLDTLPEAQFDAITRLAAYICNTPISLISLIDENRQWFKSRQGLDAPETSRDVAFCAHAINRPDAVFVVENPAEDPRFSDNPLVTGYPEVRFYAGAPLVTHDGYALGTLCVIDHKPRNLNEAQLDALRSLASEVITQLELRQKVEELELLQVKLEHQKQEAERFAHLVSHDLKSPLRAMVSLVDLIREESQNSLNTYAQEALVHLEKKATQAYSLVDGILKYTLASSRGPDYQLLELEPFIDGVVAFCSAPKDVFVNTEIHVPAWRTDAIMLQQILQNLINNAIKYNDKDQAVITIRARESALNELCIEVEDNGPGIPEKYRERVFLLFQTLSNSDRFGQKGTGIGLNTVKTLCERLNGRVELHSATGEGSLFRVYLGQGL